MTSLRIVACGPLTSIQDAGRPGWSGIGLPTAGAMDQRALRVANALVGNVADEAAIELVYAGLIVRAEGGSVELALAGGEAHVQIGGRLIASNCSFVLADGESVRIGALNRGVYAMLAIAGGIATQRVLGSRSLDARASIGGWNGRALQAGDLLPLRGSSNTELSALVYRSRTAPAVSLSPDAPIRIVFGPQDDAFTERGLQTLIGRPFTVSSAVNRMAYRLEGPKIERRPGVEMISEGTLPGAIQVPPDGSPLVLMADRQTVGGYPKIATVISADLGRLAQRRPGEAVSFQAVSAEVAREIARQEQFREVAVGVAGADEINRPELALWLFDNVADAVVDASNEQSWDMPADTVNRVGTRR